MSIDARFASTKPTDKPWVASIFSFFFEAKRFKYLTRVFYLEQVVRRSYGSQRDI
jgi:hypothetical protein